MSLSTNPSGVKLQIESKRNILLLYCILGAGLFFVSMAISTEIGPASILFFGALIIAFIFYFQINKLIINPSDFTISSLKNIMYIFIVVFVVALALDVFWWDFLTVTSFLGAILAIAGYFIMNQIIISANFLIPTNQSSTNTNLSPPAPSENKTKYCPACGASLESLRQSNFCPSCGTRI